MIKVYNIVSKKSLIVSCLTVGGGHVVAILMVTTSAYVLSNLQLHVTHNSVPVAQPGPANFLFLDLATKVCWNTDSVTDWLRAAGQRLSRVFGLVRPQRASGT